MAKKKVHECDWVGCRKRKGVKYREMGINNESKEAIDGNYGYLCPHHRAVMASRLTFSDTPIVYELEDND